MVAFKDEVPAVQLQRRVRVLDRVVAFVHCLGLAVAQHEAPLDVLLQQEPREEPQRQLAGVCWRVVQLHGIDDLAGRHIEIGRE